MTEYSSDDSPFIQNFMDAYSSIFSGHFNGMQNLYILHDEHITSYILNEKANFARPCSPSSKTHMISNLIVCLGNLRELRGEASHECLTAALG
jgi:hypothetical protein